LDVQRTNVKPRKTEPAYDPHAWLAAYARFDVGLCGLSDNLFKYADVMGDRDGVATDYTQPS
jgi:hypothetical protein